MSAQVSPSIYDARRWRSRFLQTDPIDGGSANDYDYVSGDPINATDLAGLCESAEVWCVIGILKGTETLPGGFASWQANRREGGFVYYVDTRGGNRAVLSSGACSVPGPGSFKTACMTHDLGYNLMRFFRSSGRGGSTRKAVDNLLFNDFKSVCGGLSWWRRPGCGIFARAGYEIVSGVSFAERYGVPR